MEKRYNHKDVEERIYKMWEECGYFKGVVDKDKEPYTIVLPPPNANGTLHVGHALMLAIEDLLIRRKRMQGYSALWIPGLDHAGFETQVVYERTLAEQGKTRLDFDTKTLYEDIHAYVEEVKHKVRKQLRSLGPSIDWEREKYTLDQDVIDTVYTTFEKLSSEDLIYRDNYMVNYSPHHGTTFSDLEITHIEKKTPLYYIRYPLVDRKGDEPEYVVVATTRPEPIFIDTHLAINPKDENKSWLSGRKLRNPLNDLEMDIIEDSFVDPEFGTGVVKLTPGHDKTDFDAARTHDLPVVSMLTLKGLINEEATKYEATKDLVGMTVTAAREKVLEILKDKDLIEKIDDKYTNTVAVDYKDNMPIEPMVLPNWFVKVGPLKEPALKAVTEGEVNIYPKWREVTYTHWMEEMRDWPISRQIVWGIRIPVWYNVEKNSNLQITFLNKDKEIITGEVGELLSNHSFEEIEAGLQTLIAPNNAEYEIGRTSPGDKYLQETDTFDTWFSSGHWPLVTLGYPDSEDFKYFYPTAVLETGWEIIRFWVSRMIMFGIYLTGKPPFKDVYLHGLVFAEDGRKMSKSLGNQVDPLNMVEEYGADVLRMGLITGTANGKDFAFPRDRVIAYRNFANKIWNMARFMNIMVDRYEGEVPEFSPELKEKLTDEDRIILSGLDALIANVDDSIEKYRFADASEQLYHFIWNEIADKYIEQVKDREDKDVALSVLEQVFSASLKLLHPFMPFVTEEIWSYLPGEQEKPLIISEWPETLK